MARRSALLRLVLLAFLAGSWAGPAQAQSLPTRSEKPSLIDFDEMRQRGSIRVLVPFSPLFFFVDNGQQKGLTFELMEALERWLNERHGLKTKKIDVVLIPVRRDELISDLAAGFGDIAAGNLTITKERLEVVTFADPIIPNVREMVVTGPAAGAIESRDDLSGKSVWVRESSSYFASLQDLSAEFEKAGREPIAIQAANENLEDEDILDMVNAGLVPITVVDSHKVSVWSEIFDEITVHDDIAVREGGAIGWAVRKDTPQLLAELNAFVPEIRKGSLLGNILIKRYLKDAGYVRNVYADDAIQRFEETIDVFQRYGDTFDFETLLLVAQAFQESRLDQSVRSHAGAIGIMQVLPSTAESVGVTAIEELENNVHAGTRYLRYVVDNFLNQPDLDPVNRLLLAFASYNAGPTRIQGIRERAKKRGLDPNKWFRNVDQVVAEEIGRETYQYVRNIYKYYLAYQGMAQRQAAKASVQPDTVN